MPGGYEIPGSMEAGELRHRIQLERDTLTYVSGSEIKTPTVYATVWASIEDSGGGESLKANTVMSLSKFNFRIRYRAEVSPKDRVIYKGQKLEIIAVHADEQRRASMMLECHANG